MIGILLVNLGTPDAPSVAAVRRYLRTFLMDARVVDLPFWARAMLVNGVIAPLRARSSAKAYQSIWTEQGSPLLVHGLALKEKLSAQLGQTVCVALGMRYGRPSIAQALESLSHCDRLIVLPMFPQYASAATGSAMAAVMRVVQQRWNMPDVQIIHQFYKDPGFIQAYAGLIQSQLQPDDFLLMSYHGLPVRHIEKSGCRATCDKQSDCPVMTEQNAFCYRAQCYATSRLLAQALQLSSDRYAVSFQSRLGKLPWIQPYTDTLLPTLKNKGIDHLTVVCPAFVSDCLETLEEIGIRLKAQWLQLGGKRFTLVPCLNDNDAWVQALAALIQKRMDVYA